MHGIDLFVDKFRMKYEIGYISLIESLSIEDCIGYIRTQVVYVLFDGSELVYIGQTANLSTRIRNHKKDKEFNKVIIAHCPDNEFARWLEFDLIRHFHPPYNCDFRSKRVTSQYNLSDKIFRAHIGKPKTTLYQAMTDVEY